METRKIVHDILRDFPTSRDSDKELLLFYERNYSAENTTQEFILEHFEFISCFERERRYWQNTKGLFLPSESVVRGRKKKEARIVEAIREEKKSFTQNVFAYARRIFDKK